MPARIVVDEGLPETTRERIASAVRARLGAGADVDSVLAVVTRLPSGRLTVYLNHIDDPGLVALIETELAKLR
jgi:hypothetical protein